MVKNKLVNWLVKRSGKEYSPKQRLLAILFLGVPLFMVILPFVLFIISGPLDKLLGFQKLMIEPFNFIISLILAFAGWLIAMWSIYLQFKIGRGTPAPPFPTQKLLTNGPYKYCRNPMLLGLFIIYLGLGLWLNSLSWLILVLLGIGLFWVYTKLIEEKELEVRFGKDYIDYKKRTPFLIPRIKRK